MLRKTRLAKVNTPGQGKYAVVPAEIRGWNWGAFLFGWIWGVGNNVWISLIDLIPGFAILMHIVLGVKGNEWAWRNKKWDGAEHFKRTQRTWAKWVVGVTAVAVCLVLLTVVIPNVGRFIGR